MNTENVMTLAFELAEIRQRFGAQHPDYRAQVIALRAEVERLAAQAASAPAVRMLTEDELHMAWVGAGKSHTPARIADAVQRKFCAVNAGKRIPADGKIGGVA